MHISPPPSSSFISNFSFIYKWCAFCVCVSRSVPFRIESVIWALYIRFALPLSILLFCCRCCCWCCLCEFDCVRKVFAVLYFIRFNRLDAIRNFFALHIVVCWDSNLGVGRFFSSLLCFSIVFRYLRIYIYRCLTDFFDSSYERSVVAL